MAAFVSDGLPFQLGRGRPMSTPELRADLMSGQRGGVKVGGDR